MNIWLHVIRRYISITPILLLTSILGMLLAGCSPPLSTDKRVVTDSLKPLPKHTYAVYQAKFDNSNDGKTVYVSIINASQEALYGEVLFGGKLFPIIGYINPLSDGWYVVSISPVGISQGQMHLIVKMDEAGLNFVHTKKLSKTLIAEIAKQYELQEDDYTFSGNVSKKSLFAVLNKLRLLSEPENILHAQRLVEIPNELYMPAINDFAKEQSKIEDVSKLGESQFLHEHVTYLGSLDDRDIAWGPYLLSRLYVEGWGVQKDYKQAKKYANRAVSLGLKQANYTLGYLALNGYGEQKDPKKAVHLYRKASEAGEAKAQETLGRMYLEGAGVAKNEKESFKWFSKAAEQGNATAQFYLGLSYSNGYGVAKNKSEAFKWYQKAAEQGVASAQFNLGLLYSSGDGVGKDEREAAKWYLKAAEQGVAVAQFYLGNSYRSGKGVEINAKEAANWFLKAAEQGLPEAQINIGLMYETGEGVKQDYSEALVWYSKAALKGNPDAQHHMGRMYIGGNGVSKNKKEAMEWYRKSALQGHAASQLALGAIYEGGLDGISKNPKKAVEWYGKAAEQGNAKGQYLLGKSYVSGMAGIKDYSKAVDWFRKSAQQGNDDALFWLVSMYHKGKGVAENHEEEFKWNMNGAEIGRPRSQYKVGLAYETGHGVAKDIDKAMFWYRKSAEQGDVDAKKRLQELNNTATGLKSENTSTGKSNAQSLPEKRKTAVSQTELDKVKQLLAKRVDNLEDKLRKNCGGRVCVSGKSGQLLYRSETKHVIPGYTHGDEHVWYDNTGKVIQRDMWPSL